MPGWKLTASGNVEVAGVVALASVVTLPGEGRALRCVLRPDSSGVMRHLDIPDWAASLIVDPDQPGAQPIAGGTVSETERFEWRLEPRAPGV